MVIKIYCDICNTEIPEEEKGEGWNLGQLHLSFGPTNSESRIVHLDLEEICKECTESLKEAIASHLEFLKKTAKGALET